MVKRKKFGRGGWLLLPIIAILVLGCFLGGISNLSKGHAEEDKQRLQEVLRQNVVACYATEGFYPPDIAYLEEHYGIQIDKSRYVVKYTAIAENLMPDITVLEKQSHE